MKLAIASLCTLAILTQQAVEEPDCDMLQVCSRSGDQEGIPPPHNKGKELDALKESAVRRAINLIEQWESSCDLSYNQSQGQPPKKPSEILSALNESGAICVNESPKKDVAATSSFTQDQLDAQDWLDDGSPFQKKVSQQGGPGINLSPAYIPEQLIEDGTPVTHDETQEYGTVIEVPSFSTRDITSLASTLVHESFHHYKEFQNPDGTPWGDLFDKDDLAALEREAQEATISFLCQVSGCETLSLTSSDLDQICEEIRNENEQLCANGFTPVMCAACDGHGGDGSDGEGCPEPESLPPSEGCLLPPGALTSKRLLVNGGDIRLSSGSGIVSFEILAANGAELVTQFALSQEPGLNTFQPTSMELVGTGTLIVSGIDRQTCSAVLVQVEFEVQSPSFVTCFEVYRGNDVRTPLSGIHISGTRTLAFIDYGNARIVEFNLRSGSWSSVASYPPGANGELYVELFRTSTRNSSGQVSTQYILTSTDWIQVPSTPSAYILDLDGDGIFEDMYF